MGQFKTNQRMIRYSPKPRSEYKRMIQGAPFGPSESRLLEPPEVWNLAYLSFPYERLVDHPDPMFTTHVRRSTQMRLDGTGLGLSEDPTTLVGSLLSLTAPRFLHLLARSPAIATLPLLQIYGADWLNLVHDRARVCEWGAPPDDPYGDGSMLHAKAAIQQALARK